MRYFIFYYKGDGAGKYSFGNLFIQSERFPNNKEVIAAAAKRNVPGLTFIVTGFNEFKSASDYTAFTGESTIEGQFGD